MQPVVYHWVHFWIDHNFHWHFFVENIAQVQGEKLLASKRAAKKTNTKNMSRKIDLWNHPDDHHATVNRQRIHACFKHLSSHWFINQIHTFWILLLQDLKHHLQSSGRAGSPFQYQFQVYLANTRFRATNWLFFKSEIKYLAVFVGCTYRFYCLFLVVNNPVYTQFMKECSLVCATACSYNLIACYLG